MLLTTLKLVLSDLVMSLLLALAVLVPRLTLVDPELSSALSNTLLDRPGVVLLAHLKPGDPSLKEH